MRLQGKQLHYYIPEGPSSARSAISTVVSSAFILLLLSSALAGVSKVKIAVSSSRSSRLEEAPAGVEQAAPAGEPRKTPPEFGERNDAFAVETPERGERQEGPSC